MKTTLHVLRRVAIAFATIFVIVSMSWFVTAVLPGDPARLIVGPQASESVASAVRHEYGFDQPLGRRYAKAVARLVHTGPHLVDAPLADHRSCVEIAPRLHVDLGFSPLYQQPVVALLEKRAPRSIELGLIAFLFQIVVGGLLGCWSGARSGSRTDDATLGVVAVLAAAPTFVLGLALQYVLAYRLRVVPLDGYGLTPVEHAKSIVLPTLTLGLYGSALFARIVRNEVREAMASDFVRSARAKGAGTFRIVFLHAVRAALFPITTLAVLDLGALVGGAVVTEKLFRIQGIGEMAVNAILNKDAPLVMGTVIVSSTAIVAATLAADLLGMAVDPRQRRPGPP